MAANALLFELDGRHELAANVRVQQLASVCCSLAELRLTIFPGCNRLFPFSAMAIAALQLHLSIGTEDGIAQMRCVIEGDSSWVAVGRAQGREFRMVFVEAGDFRDKSGVPALHLQVGMALSATGIPHPCQMWRAGVLHVARRALGRKRLVALVSRSLMAAKAGFVGGMIAERSLLHSVHNAAVAQTALVGKKRVRRGEWPAAVDRLLLFDSGCAQ